MRQTYALTVVCDGCGARQDCAPPAEPLRAYDQANPPGWVGGPLGWAVSDPCGNRFGDFCPTCAGMPYRQLTDKIEKRAEAVAGGRRD